MSKMGGREKEILERARDAGTIRSSSEKKRIYKNLVEKGWLKRVGIGEFSITKKGVEALKERQDEKIENNVERALGEFDE